MRASAVLSDVLVAEKITILSECLRRNDPAYHLPSATDSLSLILIACLEQPLDRYR